VLANLFIALREGLEASLVVGILIAYVTRIGRRDARGAIWLGVGLSVGTSLLIGYLLLQIDELPDIVFATLAGILSISACALVTWMVFWMAKTARNLKGNLETGIDKSLAGGTIGLVLLAFVSVGREGVETALFVWTAMQASGQSLLPFIGVVMGLGLAVGLGFAIYRGMVRLNLSTFFTWSGSLLIVLAGGVLTYGIHEFEEYYALPGNGALAFNVSQAIPEDSWYGSLLQGTIGFRPEMSWLQVIVWVLYVGITLTLFIRQARRKTPRVVTSPIDVVATAG